MNGRPFAITLDVGTSRANKTGSWRTERPEYVHNLPPCNNACPAGENIQSWLYQAEEGDYEGAWRVLVEDNPFPAIMGRVCYHPCETACNRAQVDSAVGINSVERFLGDLAIARGWKLPRGLAGHGGSGGSARSGGSGANGASPQTSASAPITPSGGNGATPQPPKRVLIIGAGPSGLSAAYHLRRMGHEVVIRDAGPRAGGMMRWGIPKYRLPREVLDAEVQRVLDMGVELELNHRVDNVLTEKQEGGFDAVFLAVGAHIGKRAYIPAGSASHILDAVSLLRSMEGEDPPQLGRRVVVYGGGNTAMDAARTARRLGAEEAVVVYRRNRERMPAHDSELEEALDEGVLMKWLSTIKEVGDGKIVVEKMELDKTGFPQPTGEFEELEADSVVLALGQDVDLSLLDGVPGIEVDDGVVQVGPNMMTGCEGVFAGGDMVPSERTVTVGIGHGKKAARYIDAWLRGGEYVPPPKHPLAEFDRLTPWYYSEAPRTMRPMLETIRRQSTFDEVVGGLDESNALFEARRCMSCGNCFACDNCYGVCPDNAVIKLDPPGAYQYEYDLDYCKGCGICAEECPCGAIQMVPEDI